MIKFLIFFLIWLGILSTPFFPVSLRGEDRSPGADGQAGVKRQTTSAFKGKAKEEMKALRKDTKRAGQEIQQSARKLPSQAGREFKKTGGALKEAGKEIKDNAKEPFENVKKLLKK